MSLESLLLPHRPALEARLGALLTALPQRYVVKSDPADARGEVAGEVALHAMIGAQLESGGKRLRGLLPVALVVAAGGEPAAALEFGAAVELIHNGTLVHDDIQDGDHMRRGRPTLWTQQGVAQAINAGDALLVGPLAWLLRAEAIPPAVRPALCAVLAEALFETIRGQVADLALRELAAPTLDDMAAVHLAKTGPLFGACCAGAVHLLGGTAESVAHALDLGRELGLAFQIRDDLLDFAGTKGRGAAGADLREGKLTWPVLAAVRVAPEQESATLRKLLARAAAGDALRHDEVARWVAWTGLHGGGVAAEQALADCLAASRLAASAAFGAKGAVVIGLLCDRLARLDG